MSGRALLVCPNCKLPLRKGERTVCRRHRCRIGVAMQKKAEALAAHRKATGQTWGEHCAGVLPSKDFK